MSKYFNACTSMQQLMSVELETVSDSFFCLWPTCCFLRSYQRGEAKVGLLGEGRIIAGMEKGLQGMCVNERRKITVPPHLAYGSTGAGKWREKTHRVLLFWRRNRSLSAVKADFPKLFYSDAL